MGVKIFLESTIYWLNNFTVLFAFGAMCFSGFNLFKNMRQNKFIPICIEKNGVKEPLDIEIKRKEFSRSELNGVLGALEKDGKFNIDYFSTKEFFDQLNDVQKSNKDEFVIYLSDSDKFERK